MKPSNRSYRRIYSGTSETRGGEHVTSGYETFHRQKRREIIILGVLIGGALVGAGVWLWTAVLPNLDLW